MSKIIRNNFEAKDVCRKATSSFVGVFMLEIIKRRNEWENPKTKTKFINDFHEEYFAWRDGWTIDKTRNRVNCVIRIIESRKVEPVLEYIANGCESKMALPEAKEYAKTLLELIGNGNLSY